MCPREGADKPDAESRNRVTHHSDGDDYLIDPTLCKAGA